MLSGARPIVSVCQDARLVSPTPCVPVLATRVGVYDLCGEGDGGDV